MEKKYREHLPCYKGKLWTKFFIQYKYVLTKLFNLSKSVVSSNYWGWQRPRNDITTLAFYGHGSEAILFFSMWQGKVIHFPVILWFYKHFLLDILQ